MPLRAVYKLQHIVDDPRYEGFGTDQRSFFGNLSFTQDFFPDEASGAAPRLGRVWRPVKVQGRVQPFNDYPCVNSVPAFSERAVAALRDVLEANGELLPLSSKLGKYYAYNVTTVADVLDPRRSDVLYFPSSRRATWIRRYEFRAAQLKGLTIFQIPEEPGQPYVTDPFIARVEEHGLDGFDFAKVWPLPQGADWESLHKRQKRRRRAKVLPKGRFKGESVFIRLGLSAGRPSRGEAKLRDRLLDELDARLTRGATRGSPLVGSLEGHQCVDGACELQLSCPNADALVRVLRPWLNDLSWPGTVRVVKRNGGFDDVEATETAVSLRRSARR
jgi:hypothetical protein